MKTDDDDDDDDTLAMPRRWADFANAPTVTTLSLFDSIVINSYFDGSVIALDLATHQSYPLDSSKPIPFYPPIHHDFFSTCKVRTLKSLPSVSECDAAGRRNASARPRMRA